MSKNKENNMLNNEPLPINYDAQKWLSWFSIDCQNMQNLCSQVFRGNQMPTDQTFIDLLTAANNAVSEVENDIIKIKEFLSPYIKPNK